MLHLYHISMATSFFLSLNLTCDPSPLCTWEGFWAVKKSVATGITGTEQQLASHPDTSEEASEIFIFFPRDFEVIFPLNSDEGA